MMFFEMGRCGQRARAYHAIWGSRGGGGFVMGHGRGARWGDGNGNRGGRRGRMFDGSELRLLLLMLIDDAPRHGYDLIREIEARTGGAYAPSPGVVYPTLTLLADMGLIEERASEGAKKLYAVTDAGKAHLEDHADAVAAIVRRVTELGAERARTDSAPVRRAMGNLRAVIQNRLGADDVTADTLHDVAAILDEAARQIERM